MNPVEDQIEKALEWLQEGSGVALATVVETWGSSPRPVGSQLVVNNREEFEGSVSGGCIESAVVSEAQLVLKENKPQRFSVGVGNQQAWDFGLACGGSLELYVEPIAPWQDTFMELARLKKNQEPCCLATDLNTGAKQLFTFDSPPVAEEAGHSLNAAIDRVLTSGRSTTWKTGDRELFLHGLLPAPRIIIGGAVHIAQPLVALANLMGYATTIIDPRTIYATPQRFPGSTLVVEFPDKALQKVSLNSTTAVAALSHSPQFDDPLLIQALRSKAFYVGALGSKTTHAARLKRLGMAGVPPDLLARIHGPIGLAIGGVNPSEIALSIMAEITKVRRGGS